MSNAVPDRGPPRDAAYWARAVSTLNLGTVPPEAINLNVSGKRLVGPIQGFGRMWQRTYQVELRGAEVTPAEVISTWKRQFATFWPKRGRFYGPATAIAPGDVALLNLDIAGGLRLATGIMVLYADEESFTFMNPRATCSPAGSPSALRRRKARRSSRSLPAPTTRCTSWRCRLALAASRTGSGSRPSVPWQLTLGGAGDGPDHHRVRGPQAPVAKCAQPPA